ncbi:hypothetical protein QAD02_019928 [Eretmocerus hayati]|uniref:Uncharacterized protein n=1 Tax=Eretmocerus hayati TaxID=131215 RepID=A0ACC2PM72_9HYME|nr:hypothetical protein QAD02_019928 [Eretmocerus hayati]
MEEIKTLLSSMHEDMRSMEDRMIGRMDTMIKEIKTENDRKTEEIEKRIMNLELKDREREDSQKEIEERLEQLENWNTGSYRKDQPEGQQTQKGTEWGALKRKLEENERRAKKNNLMIIGKKLGQAILKESVEQWLEKDLQVTCKVIRAWKIRSKKEEIIDIECKNSEKWREIMTNKRKLKGSKIYIEKDLT